MCQWSLRCSCGRLTALLQARMRVDTAGVHVHCSSPQEVREHERRVRHLTAKTDAIGQSARKDEAGATGRASARVSCVGWIRRRFARGRVIQRHMFALVTLVDRARLTQLNNRGRVDAIVTRAIARETDKAEARSRARDEQRKKRVARANCSAR